MLIATNMILKSEQNGEIILERVLHIAPNNLVAYLIRIDKDNAWPIAHKIRLLEEQLDTGEITVLDEDPFSDLRWPEDDIPESHRAHRDAANNVIKPLIEAGAAAFDEEKCNELIASIASSSGRSPKNVKMLIRRYWQRGQVPNASLPDWWNCGAKGQTRRMGKGSKRGRQSNKAKETGVPTGVNMTDEAADRAIRMLSRELRKEKPRSIAAVYRDFLSTYYSDGMIPSPYDRNVMVPHLIPAEQRPTYRQFHYLYVQEFSPRDKLTKKFGTTGLLKDHRHKPGTSRDITFGPGSVFQLDSTKPPIRLVHTLNSNLVIGSPTLYMVRDVFSGLIVGLLALIENASYLSAVIALEQTFTSKVDFCAVYDISITDEMWPFGLCSILLIDGAELSHKTSENCGKNLKVHVMKASAFRAEQKGDIETCFHLLDRDVFSQLLSFGKWPRERGEKNPAEDADHTFEALMRLLIIEVLEYNQHADLSDYPVTEGMIADNVPLHPLDIWNWGVENISGAPRREDRNVIRNNLLPPGEATVTQTGILFEGGLTYTCELAREQGWFEHAGYHGSWTVPIVYDPRTTREIYLRLKDHRRIEACTLIDNQRNNTFRNCTFWDVEEYQIHRRKQAQKAQEERIQSRAVVDAHVKHSIVQMAERRAEQDDGRSRSARVKDMTQNRQDERNRRRLEGRWHLSKEPSEELPDIDGDPEVISDEEAVPYDDANADIWRLYMKRRAKDGDSQ